LRQRNEAAEAGRAINRTAVAYDAGRDGFWLARWLHAYAIEAYVIHPSSVPVSREHRRAKTDRLDTELLTRAFLGWLWREATRVAKNEASEDLPKRATPACAAG
jgi:transposase